MEAPAYFGGSPACPSGSLPAWPHYGAEERQGLARVLESRQWWRGVGVEVDEFEREFAASQRARYALAVSNGTQALEIALGCLGIGVGHEVIIPAFTFVATATAVLSLGAVPVPVDIDPDTYCLQPEAVRRAVTHATRAIMPVHLAGQACDMDTLAEIARAHNLPIVSDSAHAHGTRWRHRMLAELSVMSAFSFQAGKLLTAGEGGAIVTDHEELFGHAWLKHTYGRPKGDRIYQHLELGTNARMTEFQAALLRAQLPRLAGQVQAREAGAARLDALLRDVPGLRVARRHPDVTTHSHYMYMVTLDEEAGVSRDLFVDALLAEGVPAYRAYPAIPDLEMFREAALWKGQLAGHRWAVVVQDALQRHPVPYARNVARNGLWLHHQTLLGDARAQAQVALAFRKIVEHREQFAGAVPR